MCNRYLTLTAFLIALLVTGCATPTKMAFQNDSNSIPSDMKPVLLMTVTLKNAYKTSYQPNLQFVQVEKKDAKNKIDRLNFAVDEKAISGTGTAETGNSYFIRMELENGEYVIRGLAGTSNSLMVYGSFFAPLHVDTNSSGTGVFYLGHVAATVRERKDGEFKAGPSIPLLDQAVTGFSGGTFEVEISDQFEKDIADFKARFPALSSVAIQKAILPSFDRAKAQKWWEEH